MIANTFQAEIQYRSGKPNWMQTEIESRRQRLMMMSQAKEKQNLYRIFHNTPGSSSSSSSSSPSSKILDATTQRFVKMSRQTHTYSARKQVRLQNVVLVTRLSFLSCNAIHSTQSSCLPVLHLPLGR
jgi:hypothetical protein